MTEAWASRLQSFDHVAGGIEKECNSGRKFVKFLKKYKDSVMQRSRSRKLDEFYALCPKLPSVLDVGVSNIDHSPQVNLFLKSFRFPDDCYTGLAVEPMEDAIKAHPNKRFVVYGGGKFPFADKAFDCVFSNAVIEHVGDEVDQLLFINEMLRTARLVYFTTPNMYFPVESHTDTLFIHWWPAYFYRWCQRRNPYWSKKNLVLLSYSRLRTLMQRSNADTFEIRRNRLLGMTMTMSVVCRSAE